MSKIDPRDTQVCDLVRGCLDATAGVPAVLSAHVGTVTRIRRDGSVFVVYDGQPPVVWRSWIRVRNP